MSSPPLGQISSFSSSVTPETLSYLGLTEAEFTTLGRLASEAKSRAYCPYSRFRVGAALLITPSADENHEDGDHQSGQPIYITGANVENASYPVGICAERAAFARAMAEGHGRHGQFRAVAVATDVSPPSSPCGMCRQFIREFCPPKTPVIMFDKDLAHVIMTIEQLLPMSFDIPERDRSQDTAVAPGR